MSRLLTVAAVFLVFFSSAAAAQSFEAGVHFVGSDWSEFEGTDFAIGGRLTWKPVAVIGVDADLSWYPSDYPGERIAFSGNRFEGLFGVTVGSAAEPLAPVREGGGGFLRSSEAPNRSRAS